MSKSKTCASAITHYRNGLSSMASKDFLNAICYFKSAIAIDPHYFSVYFTLSTLYGMTQQKDEAKTIIKKAKIESQKSKQYEFEMQLVFHEKIKLIVHKISCGIKDGFITEISSNIEHTHTNNQLMYLHLSALGVKCNMYDSKRIQEIINETSNEIGTSTYFFCKIPYLQGKQNIEHKSLNNTIYTNYLSSYTPKTSKETQTLSDLIYSGNDLEIDLGLEFE